MCVCVRERVSVRENERERVCVCVRERDSMRVCVCERERRLDDGSGLVAPLLQNLKPLPRPPARARERESVCERECV